MSNVPQTNDHDGVSSEDIARMEERWNRWGKPLAWTRALLFLIALYVFGYPAIFWWLGSTGALDNISDFVVDAIRYSFVPLRYLDENFALYKTYLEWLIEIFK